MNPTLIQLHHANAQQSERTAPRRAAKPRR